MEDMESEYEEDAYRKYFHYVDGTLTAVNPSEYSGRFNFRFIDPTKWSYHDGSNIDLLTVENDQPFGFLVSRPNYEHDRMDKILTEFQYIDGNIIKDIIYNISMN